MDESGELLPYLDPELSIEDRVTDLIGRMTLQQKCGQMLHESPALERLGIPAYNWWNECLHGVARAGIATVFPQAIGLGATWNDELMLRVARVISDEARAKHHEFQRQGDTTYYAGLTFWSPNINIFRDPRWGRGQETYGECPFLTGRMGVAFCRGLQGDDERYLKLVATLKHFAVHSGPEGERHSFNARVSVKDLRETYLPAFRDCILEAGAYSVMGAYNRTNGEVCCGSRKLLTEILRGEWGFTGYVVSDCWAVQDFHENHEVSPDAVHSAALAVKNGCDLNCGCAFEKLVEAAEQGLLTEEHIETAVRRLMTARMKLGMFDPPESVPFSSIPYEVNDCAEHRQVALEAARQSMVLLKNDGILPLSKQISSLAVIGPNAYDRIALLGNYHGTPSLAVTPLEGIRACISSDTEVWYAEGCEPTGDRVEHCAPSGRISEAVSGAKRADAVIMVMGLNKEIEGEQGDAGNSDAAGDRIDLELPGLQQPLLEAVCATGTPVVLVAMSGSPVALNWAHENANAVLQAWYPGEEGGTAVAETLFGDYSPAGRLPITFVCSVDQLPDFRDYSMKNRTYRYLESEPLYPFGYGLSYTTFEYSDLVLTGESIGTDETLGVKVTVTNTGSVRGDEVVQLYVTDLEASVRVPQRDLRGFQRIHLAPGESRIVSFTLTPRALSLIDPQGRRIVEPGVFRLSVGGSQPDSTSEMLTGHPTLKRDLRVTGSAVEIPY